MVVSLRSSERGLKFNASSKVNIRLNVAPFVGAWIEIEVEKKAIEFCLVAPFVGAWIEILCQVFNTCHRKVAPFVGAWIEMEMPSPISHIRMSLRSSERGLKFPCY